MTRGPIRRLRAALASQKVRFLLAGCLNTAIDFAILNLLVRLAGLPVLPANAVSVLLGISISYLLNHFFVFRHPERPSLKRFLQFFAVTGFSSLVLQSLVIFSFEVFFDTTFGRSLLFIGTEADQYVLSLNIAKAAAVLVGLVWNFTFYRFVIFRRRASDGEVAEVAATDRAAR